MRPLVSDLWVRFQGAILGGSLSLIAAAHLGPLRLYWADLPVAGLGVVVGIGLGFVTAPAAIRSDRPLPFAIVTALKAVVIGLVCYLAWSTIQSVRAGRQPDLGMGALGGTLLFFVPMAFVVAAPVTVPIAILAVGLLRVGRRSSRIVAAILAVVVATTTGLATVGPSLNFADGDRSPLAGLEGRPIQLEWTVANHSHDGLELSVWTPAEGGLSGWSEDVPACFTTTGTSAEAAGWFVAVEHGESFPRLPTALVSADQAPGTNPSIWIDVTPEGALTATPDRPAPPDHELTVDLCAETGTR